MAVVLNGISYKGLSNVSFNIEDGKVTGILSSSLSERKLLGDIISKKVNVPGVVCSYHGDNIGYNYRNPDDMLIGLSVREELTLALKRYSYKKDTINKKCEDALKIVSLDSDILDRSSLSLSSSEKKLVTIAINLITNPKILILDDPWLYLDDEYRKRISKLFKKIAKNYEKIIVILSSNVSFVYDTCDYFVLIDNGKLVFSGNKKKLVEIDDKLVHAGLDVPNIIDFINATFKRKNVTLEKTFDIKELMKDVYRNVK